MHVGVLTDGYPPAQPGGAQRIAAQLAEGYQAMGHDVTVVATAPEAEAEGPSEAAGVRVHRLATPRPRDRLAYLSVHNPAIAGRVEPILDQAGVDVVHAHNVHWLSKTALREAARVAPVAKTYHDAGTFAYGELTHDAFGVDASDEAPPPARAYAVDRLRQARRVGACWFPLRNRLHRAALDRYVDVGIAVSRELQHALRANGMPCGRVVRNGIDPARMRTSIDEATFRAEQGLADAPFVLFGGRTGYTKGGKHLAQAFADAREQVSGDAKLLVTGDDAYVERMRATAGRHGEAIETTGWLGRDELAYAFQAARVAVTPSIHLDPFPTVNLEAMAAGTPVVTTCMGGARELVRDRVDGRVVNPLDVGSLADALAGYLADPSKAREHGEAGRRRVERGFRRETQVAAYLALLARLADGAQAAPDAAEPPAGDILAEPR